MPVSPNSPAPSGSSAHSTSRGWVFLGLFAATLLAYLPALSGDFLWDDAGHVTRADLQTFSGLFRIWTEIGATQQYYPLLHTAFWVEHQLWGDAPLGYHLANVLWHAVSATVLGAILQRLRLPGAGLAALVFALHPVCVESVAWISEQKNTLSLLFALAAMQAWLNFEEDRRLSRYLIATAWFAAALATKTVTASLPAVLLVLAWWRRGRLSWRTDFAPLLPWLLLGTAAGLGTAWMETTQIGATGNDFALSGHARIVLAGKVVWFYATKLVWPTNLLFFYPRWDLSSLSAWAWIYPTSAAGLVCWAWRWRGRKRGPLAALLVFGGTLFPVLGFVNVYPFVFSYVADHFQYHASPALIALLCSGIALVWSRLALPSAAGVAASACLVLFLGVLTWNQSGHYRDVFALYRHTLSGNPNSWVAQLNLGTALDEAGQTAEALPHLLRANELKPDFPETLNSLGNVLNRLGRPREALPLLERALALQPRFDTAHNTLGVTLMALGKPEESMASFNRALALNPRLTVARLNLAWALANARRTSEALAMFAVVLREQPNHAEAEFKTGLTHLITRAYAAAEPHLRRAVELAPENVEMRHVLGMVLLEEGRPAEAASHFERVLQLSPGHPGAERGLREASRLFGR